MAETRIRAKIITNKRDKNNLRMSKPVLVDVAAAIFMALVLEECFFFFLCVLSGMVWQ